MKAPTPIFFSRPHFFPISRVELVCVRARGRAPVLLWDSVDSDSSSAVVPPSFFVRAAPPRNIFTPLHRPMCRGSVGCCLPHPRSRGGRRQ